MTFVNHLCNHAHIANVGKAVQATPTADTVVQIQDSDLFNVSVMSKLKCQWSKEGQPDFCVALISFLPGKKKKPYTSTLPSQQPLLLISTSISSIALTVCSGCWTNSPFYSTRLCAALMAGTTQRRVNYCTAHGWHTGLQLCQFKKHDGVTRCPTV